MKKKTAESKKQSTNQNPSREERPFDVIVYGATGYTGEIITEYLLENYGFNRETDPIRWAIAGRNKTKLELLRGRLERAAKQQFAKEKKKIKEEDKPEESQELGPREEDNGKLQFFVAEALNHDQLRLMVRKTRVVISTVGPYLKFGIPLVKECVENQTDYVDLTGEVPFVRKSIDMFHEQAHHNGTRIIHGCGFDALPSDLGTLTLQDYVITQFHEPADEVKMIVVKASGGISSGTVATVTHLLEWAQDDEERFAMLRDPYSLNHKAEGLPKMKDLNRPTFDRITGWWLAPFFMASYNERVVRRSNELLSFYYGRKFKYSEAVRAPKVIPSFVREKLEDLPSFVKPITRTIDSLGAGLMTVGVGGLTQLLMYAPTRDIVRNLHKYLANNPNKEQRESGSLKLVFSARKDGKEVARTVVTSDKDPGYGGTAIMIAESAICLAQDHEKLRGMGGVLTPASGLHELIRVRLEKTGVFEFESSYL